MPNHPLRSFKVFANSLYRIPVKKNHTMKPLYEKEGKLSMQWLAGFLDQQLFNTLFKTTLEPSVDPFKQSVKHWDVNSWLQPETIRI